MDDDAFLAAIRQQWGDPRPLLAFADWLDERRDPRALALRTLAAGSNEAFLARATFASALGRSPDSCRVWLRACDDSYLRYDAAAPVIDAFKLWLGKEVLRRERQAGRKPPECFRELLETKRRWLRGEVGREELDRQRRLAEESPLANDARVILREVTSFHPQQRLSIECLYGFERAVPLCKGSLSPFDELGLRLATECGWRLADAPTDLKTTVERQGPLGYAAAVHCLLQTARLLSDAGQGPLVRHGLTPERMIAEGDKLTFIESWQLTLFQHPAFDWVNYTFPETHLDGDHIDPRSNLYCLGCILFFLLTGNPPFAEGTLAQRLIKHQATAPPTLRSVRPDAPADLEAIYQRLMAKRVEGRYASPQELCTVLEAWLKNHPAGIEVSTVN